MPESRDWSAGGYSDDLALTDLSTHETRHELCSERITSRALARYANQEPSNLRLAFLLLSTEIDTQVLDFIANFSPFKTKASYNANPIPLGQTDPDVFMEHSKRNEF